MELFVSKRAIAKMYAIVIAVVLVVAAIGGGLVYYLTLPKPSEKAELIFGASLSLTGASSTMGLRCKQGYQLFEDMVNARGGIRVEAKKYPIRFIIYDDKSDPTTTKSLYEKLIAVDNVDFIVGPFSSACAMTAAPVAEKYKMVNIHATGASKDIYSQGFKYAFCGWPQGTQDVLAVLPFDFFASLPANQKPTTIGVIHLADVAGRSFEEPISTLCQQRGYQYIFHEEIPTDVKDVTTVISKLKAANPDVLIDWTFLSQTTLVTRALSDLNWRPKIYFGNLVYMAEYVQSVGNLSIGVVFSLAFHSTELMFASSPFTQPEFVNAYKAKYGSTPDAVAGVIFASGQVMMQAIEAVGTMNDIANKNQDKIRDWIRSNEHLTVVGNFKFDDRGVPSGGGAVAQYTALGESHVIYPKAYAKATFIYPYSPPT